MKRLVAGLTVGVLLMVAGFMAGRWVEYSISGYRYKMLEETSIESEVGPIYTRYVAESVGSAILDPGTSILEVDGRIIYRAKRAFQESVPVINKVRVNNGMIEWEDGEYTFSLRMQHVVQPNQPNTKPGA